MSDDRFNKIDDAIQRLATVASDLSKMLAVNEHRIGQQEKTTENIVVSMDKRRNEVDSILKDVYTTIRSEINLVRESATKQHEAQTGKIEQIQKTIYLAMGAVSVLSIVAPFVTKHLF